jgi:hypothetical protein
MLATTASIKASTSEDRFIAHPAMLTALSAGAPGPTICIDRVAATPAILPDWSNSTRLVEPGGVEPPTS